MSIVVEMEASGRKAGRVCSRDYRQGTGCPLIVRSTSEDVLTANVFGILRRLRPSLWLRPMLNEAFRTRRFATAPMANLDVGFWRPVAPPANRATFEGNTEVDVLVRFGGKVLFVEAKYHAPLSARTKYDEQRDQVARLLDVAYQEAVATQLFRREPYVLVIGVPDQEPALVTRYRDAAQVREALRHHRAAPDFEEMSAVLSRRIGYVSWSSVAATLRASREAAYRAEVPFLDDVAAYIDHKMEQARLRSTRQLPLLLPPVESCDAA